MTKESINTFFMKVSSEINSLAKIKNHYDKYLATNFNVLDFVYFNENNISWIISELLCVNGQHAQGDKFLRAFLRVLANCEASIECNDMAVKIASLALRDDLKCIIKLEDSTLKNRRIDITIDFHDFIIGIENKPWACEQDEQLKDYDDELCMRYRENYSLVYLSPNQKPTTANQNKGVLLMNYKTGNSLTLWLEECFRQCASEKIRYFIRDFINKIDNAVYECEESINDKQA